MENLELIRNIRLFKELDEQELGKFLAIAQEKKFSKGAVIIEEGEEGKALYVVKNGTVSVFKRDGALESELVKLFAGEHFGEMSLVEDARTSAWVKAHNEVVCLVIPKSAFLQLMESDYQVAAKVYKAFAQTLCDRLRQTSTDLVAWKPEFQT